MIVPYSFEIQANSLFGGRISARWEYWDIDDKGMVTVNHPDLPLFQKHISKLDSGRFVIYQKTRTGRHLALFDVVYKDGTYHPLDHRVIKWLIKLDGARGAYERIAPPPDRLALARSRPKDAEDVRAEGIMADALAAHYEAEVGLHTWAMGAPGAPAAKNSGNYVVTDKRRFQNLAG